MIRRWRPSPTQKACLESMFASRNMPGTPEINQLALGLGLAPRQVRTLRARATPRAAARRRQIAPHRSRPLARAAQVRIWFQNKRQRTHVDKKKPKAAKKGPPPPRRPLPCLTPCTSSAARDSECLSPGGSVSSQPALAHARLDGGYLLLPAPFFCVDSAAALGHPPVGTYQLREEQHACAGEHETFGVLEAADPCGEFDLSHIQIGELIDALGCC